LKAIEFELVIMSYKKTASLTFLIEQPVANATGPSIWR